MKLLAHRGLPTPLPTEPLSTVAAWLKEATDAKVQPNPNAMSLATVGADNRPSARIVLCKDIAVDPGYLVFVTNYQSRKGQEIAHNPRAAVIMHWDDLHRQVRIEGIIQKAPEAESDALHNIRPWQSRLGAWASEQSQPVSGRAALLEQLKAKALHFNTPPVGPDERAEDSQAHVPIPRPPHWGAYRLYADRVELWVEGEYRIHDRICYTRSLTLEPNFLTSPWQWQTLQP